VGEPRVPPRDPLPLRSAELTSERASPATEPPASRASASPARSGAAAREDASRHVTRLRAGRLAGRAAAFLGVAAAVVAVGRAEGGFEVEVWAPFGIALALVCGALLALGWRPARLTAAAAVAAVALGGWSVASTQWGGLSDEAWRMLDQSLLAACALLAGSLLARATRSAGLVLAAVLAGVVVQAVELVLRPALGAPPSTWIYGRTLEGPVGYHNAQAGLLVLGLPLALVALGHRRAAVRAAAGAAAALLAAALLLTQSRAGIGAAVVCAAVTLAWARDSAIVLRVVPLAGAAALLTIPLGDVDAALLTEGGGGAVDAFATYALWTSLLAAAIAALSAVPLGFPRLRRVLVAALAGILLAGAGVGIAAELRQGSPFDRLLSRFDDSDPNLAAPGETRLASLSLNGRREAARVSWTMISAQPLAGAGQGTFARRWTEERRYENRTLYLLQPHSLAVELAAELGAVGLGLFLAFAGLVLAAVARGPSRLLAAAAAGAFVAVVLQAAVDWTWWFPGVTAPVLLVAGAAAGGRPRSAPGAAPTAVGAVVIAGAVLLLSAPLIGQVHLTRAGELADRDLRAARAEVDEALRWNRWDGDAFALRGRIEEAAGSYQAAALDYQRAAELSQAHWLNRLRQVRAYQRGGDGAAWTRACRLASAENPGETTLRYQLC
jgi:tetratricopeptide (TPR) repeat protein